MDFSFYWLSSRAPVVELYEDTALSGIDLEAVKKRKEFLYSDGLDSEIFNRYSKMLKDLVGLAGERNSKIIFIYPPTLLGDLPGALEVENAIRGLKKDYGVEFYDFSGIIKEPKYYQDHDHLNTLGVELFVEKYLKLKI